MRIIAKAVSAILVICTLLSLICVPSLALQWDGSSTGGGGNGYYADVLGFAVRRLDDNVAGYRFSVVDKNGTNKGQRVIDVFRPHYYDSHSYTASYKFSVKYNKKQLINNQNSGFSTSSNYVYCYKESDMGFATALPYSDGMEVWQNNINNLNAVLSKLGIGSIALLKNGDKVLVEPLYDVMLENVYHTVTVTEIALYGKYLLGANSNGGASYTASSWGFIAFYTNMHYPNELYTPDGQGLWTSASPLSSQATFYNIINSGYGVGIAYTETKSDFSPALEVRLCEAWPGNVSTRQNNHYGISYGNSFANWEYGHSYPMSGGTVWYSVYFPPESENCYVKQSVWVVDGGSTSRNVWSNSNTWYDVSLNPKNITDSINYITVKARVDQINSSGGVIKYGTEKTFYIPIRPVINRYKVSMINIEGDTAAYRSNDGVSGCVYVGQRATATYNYTSEVEWGSYNNLYGDMYKWYGGQWTKVASSTAPDVSKEKSILNGSVSSTLTSRTGQIRVPDNSGSGSNIMKFKLTTNWCNDTARTEEITWHNIPIVKADVQITDIILVNESGYRVDADNLTPGQNVSVIYTYYNNTKCRVYIEGYKNDLSKISGIYAIDPYESINVAGYSFTVPNQRSISIWGGVYLEGASRGNTTWETNGTNNQMTLNCSVNHPLRLQPITPNASYRETTEVITSYWLRNSYSDDYTPNSNITVKFYVYDSEGTLIEEKSKTRCIVPGNDKNLIYFKWRVPDGVGTPVTIKAEIVDGGVAYNRVVKNYTVIPYTMLQTPDTEFVKNAPSGYSVPTSPSATTNYASWSEYVYENGAFVRKNYAKGLTGRTDSITPATGETHEYTGGKWQMKSGYGISINSYRSIMSNVSGYLPASSNAYTLPQYSLALYPEYRYSTSSGKCTTLERNGNYSRFPNFEDYGRVHFTPIWFPDDEYTVKIYHSDCWTPSGMLSVYSKTNAIVISGSAYDDHYVGH